ERFNILATDNDQLISDAAFAAKRCCARVSRGPRVAYRTPIDHCSTGPIGLSIGAALGLLPGDALVRVCTVRKHFCKVIHFVLSRVAAYVWPTSLTCSH